MKSAKKDNDEKNNPASIRKITYIFDIHSEKEKKFELEFNEETMELVHTDSASKLGKGQGTWTNLEFKKCSHCPYKKNEIPKCPVAFNIAYVADYFKDEISHRKTTIGVITKERTYIKKTGLQDGLQSILGLIMATSACPHFQFLRPMSYFHLPFSTTEEALFRYLATYFMRQFFNTDFNGSAKSFEFSFDNLQESLEKIHIINDAMIERIRTMTKGDADANAITLLDSFANILSIEINNNFTEVKKIFDQILSEKTPSEEDQK